MTESAGVPMPAGWTTERLREWSGDRTARALPLDFAVTDAVDPTQEPIQPSYVLAFGDLCVVQDSKTGDWLMGSMDMESRTIQWWSNYGDDLSEAIRGL